MGHEYYIIYKNKYVYCVQFTNLKIVHKFIMNIKMYYIIF